MHHPPHKLLIDPDELFASRDIRMQDRKESQYPHLQAYRERLVKRPAYQRALEKGGAYELAK